MNATIKTAYPLSYAFDQAKTLLDKFSPYCKRIEIAGSIRRRKPQVKDIELVVVPLLRFPPGKLFDDGERVWNQLLAKRRSWGGAMPDGSKLEHGRLLVRKGSRMGVYDCPEEVDFFGMLQRLIARRVDDAGRFDPALGSRPGRHPQERG